MLPQQIGMIGLGLLGTALAERFLSAGIRVLGYDIDATRASVQQALGGGWSDSAREVFESCDRVVLSLPDSNVVQAILTDVAGLLRPGIILIDTTTGDPVHSSSIGNSLAERGIHYLDATVAGSSEEARAGKVIVMIGGDQAIADQCADLFACFAREWFYLGSWGAGARMKLVVNLVLGLNRAVLAEGLSFASSCGLDLTQTLRILKTSAAYSHVMDTKGAKMVERDFRPQARLAQHLKDVKLILAEANRLEAATPLSIIHAELLEQVRAAGWGDSDNASIITAFESHPEQGAT